MIQLSIQKDHHAKIVLSGDIVSELVNDLKSTIDEVLSKECLFIHLDMAKVQSVNSSGLSVLIGAHSKVKSRNGALILENASTDLYEFFQSMNLTDLLNIEKNPAAPETDKI